MEKVILSFLIIATTLATKSQNVGIGTNTPDPSAKLEVSSNNSGFLPPRMSTTERDGIVNPAVGLQVYNTTSHCLEIFDFGKWNAVYCVPIDSTTIVDSTLLTDIDGHIYPTVKICDQIWMAKNMDVARYRNGDIIPQVTDPTEWANLATGAWCWYNNDSANGAIYGRLYNWYAVNDPRGLAPEGWHVPSDGEWDTLANCLGGADIAGSKIKEVGTIHWYAPNLGATNSSGFCALPAGYTHSSSGAWLYLGEQAWWWTSTKYPCCSTAIARYSWNDNTSCYKNNIGYQGSFSIRCVKDTPITTLKDGLVAYYPFSGNAGDSSGNGNHGTVNGATLTTDRFGNTNSAYFFSGAACDTRIDAQINTTTISTSNEYSVSFWVKKMGDGCMIHPRIMEFFDPNNIGALQLNWDVSGPNVLMVETGNSTSNYLNLLYSIPNWLNEWHQMVVVCNTSELKLYDNGINVNTAVFTGLPRLASSVSFGRMNHPSYNTFKGCLDDIRIYNRALSQSEVTYLATH